MAEKALFFTTGATGDGASPYTQAEMFAWLRRTFIASPATEGVLVGYANALAVTTAGTTKVTVGTGSAYAYGLPYESDAAVDVAIPTPASATRVDYVVLRVAWAAQTVRITRVAGTEGAGLPALTQSAGTTWDVPLASASITTGGAITVTDRRTYCHFATRVATANLDDLAVTAGKIAADAVTTAKILDLNVTTGKLAADAVTAAKLADDAVVTANIVNLNVTTGKINDLAVTAAKIADSNVTGAKIAVGAVDSIQLADGAVTAPKLSVTVATVSGGGVVLPTYGTIKAMKVLSFTGPGSHAHGLGVTPSFCIPIIWGPTAYSSVGIESMDATNININASVSGEPMTCLVIVLG